MKALFKALALLLLGPFSHAAPVKVGGTGVTFEAPEGFRPLSKEIIALKWPSNRAPA